MLIKNKTTTEQISGGVHKVKCLKCGQELKEGSIFCTRCGTKVVIQNTTKGPFVWKDQYTYIVIGVGIVLAGIIGFGVRTARTPELPQVATETETQMVAEETEVNDVTGLDNESDQFQYDDMTIEEPEERLFDDVGVHTYELIVSDVTWTEAYEQCLRMGGHLVRINSEEESNAILNQIYLENKGNIKFWIGGYRDENDNYRWVYNDSYEDRYPLVLGDVMIDSDSMYRSYWLDGEPSLYDDATESEEDRMNMFYIKSLDRWVWNDVPDDVLSVASFYSGSMGYICEYE